jgi:orotate phosphoribosyltransferase
MKASADPWIDQITAMDPALDGEVRAIVRDTRAVMPGHFLLQSGRHSPCLLRFAAIGRAPQVAARIAALLHERATAVDFGDALILCPESAGFFLGNALGDRTGRPVAVAKIDLRRRPTMVLRAGHILAKQPVVVVNDVVTTGASLEPLIALARSHGELRGVVAFAALDFAAFNDFCKKKALPGMVLARTAWPTSAPAQCPQCAAGDPLLPAAEFN